MAAECFHATHRPVREWFWLHLLVLESYLTHERGKRSPWRLFMLILIDEVHRIGWGHRHVCPRPHRDVPRHVEIRWVQIGQTRDISSPRACSPANEASPDERLLSSRAIRAITNAASSPVEIHRPLLLLASPRWAETPEGPVHL